MVGILCLCGRVGPCRTRETDRRECAPIRAQSAAIPGCPSGRDSHRSPHRVPVSMYTPARTRGDCLCVRRSLGVGGGRKHHRPRSAPMTPHRVTIRSSPLRPAFTPALPRTLLAACVFAGAGGDRVRAGARRRWARPWPLCQSEGLIFFAHPRVAAPAALVTARYRPTRDSYVSFLLRLRDSGLAHRCARRGALAPLLRDCSFAFARHLFKSRVDGRSVKVIRQPAPHALPSRCPWPPFRPARYICTRPLGLVSVMGPPLL